MRDLAWSRAEKAMEALDRERVKRCAAGVVDNCFAVYPFT